MMFLVIEGVRARLFLFFFFALYCFPKYCLLALATYLSLRAFVIALSFCSLSFFFSFLALCFSVYMFAHSALFFATTCGRF
jgi:hypothetical protein